MPLNTQSLARVLAAETTVSAVITSNTAFTLPSAANMAGKLYTIYNPSASTANVLVNASDASLVVTVQPGTAAVVTPISDTPVTNAAWMVVSVGLSPATASLPGIVNTAAQTFAGVKTFSNGVAAGAVAGKYLGSQYASGTPGGNNQVQSTFTLPTNTKMVEIRVAGDSFAGVAGTHNGFYSAIFSVDSANRFFVFNDVNHSGAQGFVATYSAGIITVQNKAGMASNQSGDTLFVAWG